VKGHLKLLAVLAAIVAATCAAPPPAFSQAPPPVHHFGASPQAKSFLDSLATEARTKRIENAGCLTGYAVIGDTLILGRIAAATYEHADSANIYGFVTTPMCPFGVPAIHSHNTAIVKPTPSRLDFNSSVREGFWAVVLIVRDTSWQITVY